MTIMIDLENDVCLDVGLQHSRGGLALAVTQTSCMLALMCLLCLSISS